MSACQRYCVTWAANGTRLLQTACSVPVVACEVNGGYREHYNRAASGCFWPDEVDSPAILGDAPMSIIPPRCSL